MEIVEGTRYGGAFFIDGKDRSGEITFKGDETNLRIQDEDFFRPNKIDDRCIHGILHDRTRLSLLMCNAPSSPGSTWTLGERYHHANVFPHYVLHGARHLSPRDAVIEAISFVVDDAGSIFDEFFAFGTVLSPRRHIGALVRSNAKQIKIDRVAETGKEPAIAYFAGKRRIFTAETSIGEVSASHNPQPSGVPTSGGVFIRNTITIDIRFQVPIVFEESISALLRTLRFLEIMAGRAQNLEGIGLRLREGERKLSHLALYWSSPPHREVSAKRNPNTHDLPIDAAREPEVFGRVLTRWLERDDEWRDARSRFSNSFSQQRSYSIDRLIGSANMFDILPAAASPPPPKLSNEVLVASKLAQKAFRGLPVSPQRESILGALGRLKTNSLRDKIHHRARPIADLLGGRVSGLFDVLSLAVDCRNHYVHGSKPKVAYNGHFFETVPFLTDSLEFVFAASDLLDAGWDLAAYAKRGSTMSHPFGSYLASYSGYLTDLNSVLPAKLRIAAVL